MKNGVCPKCNSTEIYRGPSTEGEGVSAGGYNSLVEISVNGKLKTLWLNTFICRTCGYIEMHVANETDLHMLPGADGWSKVEEHDEQ